MLPIDTKRTDYYDHFHMFKPNITPNSYKVVQVTTISSFPTVLSIAVGCRCVKLSIYGVRVHIPTRQSLFSFPFLSRKRYLDCFVFYTIYVCNVSFFTVPNHSTYCQDLAASFSFELLGCIFNTLKACSRVLTMITHILPFLDHGVILRRV